MGHSITDDLKNLHISREKNQWLISNSEITTHVTKQWFEQNYWLNQGRLLGANSGRGAAWVIKTEWGKWVLRHYFRGGLYAKLNRDHYLWTGLNNTRVFKEFSLLEYIHDLGLPCPKPIAASVVKKGLFYQNDLIMGYLNHEQTFAQWLSKSPKNDEIWQLIGTTIARFHQHGIFHSDLNAHNILLAKEQVYIIDLDKSSIKTKATGWQAKNLNRLKRSIEKVSQLSCEKQLKRQWQILTSAYDAKS